MRRLSVLVTAVAAVGFLVAQPAGADLPAPPPVVVPVGSVLTPTSITFFNGSLFVVSYGQAYPLPTWPNDPSWAGFDSGELGYGPQFLTAATQKASWSLPIPAGTPTGTTYTYFCRIHPFMRGVIRVVK